MAAKAGFVPPFFGDFNKRVKDLLKKKYDFDHGIHTINKSSSGVTLKTGASFGKDGLAGYVKPEYKDKTLGEFNAEIHTGGKAEAKAKFTNLADGVTVTVSGTPDPSGKAELQYAQDAFAGSLSADVTQKNGTVRASAAIGADGLSVGAEAASKFDVKRGGERKDGESLLADFNVAMQYEGADYTAALFTENWGDKLTGSYYHSVSPSYQLGTQYEFDIAHDNARKLTVGNEYALNKDTIFKGKFDTQGNLSTAIQHNLADPRVQVGLAASFRVDSKARSVASNQFGVNFTFGDF